MKLLADENFPRPTVEALQSQGHDVLWARTECPGLMDRSLIELAEANGRLILTLDKDFRHLALQRPAALKNCGVTLFRVFPAVPETLDPLVNSALHANHSWIGHISLVTKDGIEMFPTGAGNE